MLKHQNEASLASVSDTTQRNAHKQYDWDMDPSGSWPVFQLSSPVYASRATDILNCENPVMFPSAALLIHPNLTHRAPLEKLLTPPHCHHSAVHQL